MHPLFATYFGMTITEFLTVLGVIGTALGFLLTYRKELFSSAIANEKAQEEIRRMRLQTETEFVDKAKQWQKDFEQIGDKHALDMKAKDDEIKRISDLMLALVSCEEYRKAFQTLMSRSDIPYWEADPEGMIVFANGSMCELFGVRKEQLLGEGWAPFISEEDRRILQVKWFAIVQDRETNATLKFTLVNQITNERHKVFSIYSFVYDEGDKVTRVVGITLPETQTFFQEARQILE